MKINNEVKQYIMIVLGAFIFALGVNLFLVPVHAYTGGIMGIAQLIRTIFYRMSGIENISGFDPAGIINLVLNIPLLFLAYFKLSNRFFKKTLLTIALQSLFLSIIPVASHVMVDDTISAILITGITSGIGLGMSLHAGGSSGGLDIIAVYLSQRYQNISVGRWTAMSNYVIYAIFALLFEIKVALYSIIYAFITGLVVDKLHVQNIKTKVIIITKSDKVHKAIVSKIVRGVTYWKGYGAYKDQPTNIMITLVSKYELNQLKRIVSEIDPQAFIIHSDGNYVIGNFEKRLVD